MANHFLCFCVYVCVYDVGHESAEKQKITTIIYQILLGRPRSLYSMLRGTSICVEVTPAHAKLKLRMLFIKMAYVAILICVIQVCTLHDGCKQGIDQQSFNRKSISRKITHPQFLFKQI